MLRRGALRIAKPLIRALSTNAPPSPPEPSSPVRIYRLQGITLLRALLRVKILQLGGGVAVLLPTAQVISSGGLPTLAEGGVMAAIVGGTLVTGTTLSWYAQRIVGELAWLPERKALRVSTLTMWGERSDRELTADDLQRDGLAPPATLPPGEGAYPPPGFAPLKLGGITYICVWNARHVEQPEALARMLKRDELPFHPDGPPDAMPTSAPPRRSAARDDEQVKFFD